MPHPLGTDGGQMPVACPCRGEGEDIEAIVIGVQDTLWMGVIIFRLLT